MTEKQHWPDPVYLTKDHAINMTLRDYFAAKATEEDIKKASKFVGAVEIDGVLCAHPNERQLARYIHADMMLKAREQ